VRCLTRFVRLLRNHAGLVSLIAAGAAPLIATPAPAMAVAALIEDHCATCHGDSEPEANLDLTSLAYRPEDSANFALWVKIHDRVAAGEMPPKKKPRPAADELKTFLSSLTETLTASQTAQLARDGRAVHRRLNRYEYENALRDLLHIPWAQVKDKLPLDGERHGFNKSGEALDVSFVQIERYLAAADYAMRQAMGAAFERPAQTTRRIYARDAFGTFSYWPRENGTLPDRLAFPVLDSHAQPEVRAGRAPNSTPETREREAVGKVASICSDAGGYAWGFSTPTAGRYRIRLKGYSIWVSGGGIGRWFYEGQGAEKAPVYWLPVWHRPNADEVWPGRNDEPIGFYAQSAGQTRPLGAIDFTPEPGVGEIEATLAAGESVRTDGMRLFRTRVNGTDEQYVNPLATKEGMPGYAVQWLEVEGPLPDESATAGYRLLFGDLPMRRVESGQPGGVPLEGLAPAGGGAAPGGRGGFAPGGGGRGGFGGGGGFGAGGGGGGRGGRGPGGRGGGAPVLMAEVVSEKPTEDAERLLRAFVRVAFRRPADEEELKGFRALFDREFAQGSGFARALLTAYTGVLASPGFVFLEEKPGKLDAMALATRLSLFLWNSTPDAALRSRAESGELLRPDVLRAETERLLGDPRADRFVEAFADYWLDLRKIDDNSPSSTLYNDYELDDPLKLAAIDETRLFVAELVRRDLPARNIVASDFTFLNERLARHYGIDGVHGAQMRRVALPPTSDRGGLMTMASVLKVTANGTTTSPVLRGHWITERLMGIETPPPPASVKAVEPDIRGAVTIRQQLAKHRADPSCASCHTKMDPPGFALENYDVMGGFRDRYRAMAENVPPVPGYGMNGQPFAFHYGLPVDAAGELPDGRPFRDVREFKRLAVQDERALARHLASQLIIFATGAPVVFAERATLDRIVDRTAASRYGVRSLIHEIVQSELFQTK
jgi:mono/diheme cytochrome c family protein